MAYKSRTAEHLHSSAVLIILVLVFLFLLDPLHSLLLFHMSPGICTPPLLPAHVLLFSCLFSNKSLCAQVSKAFSLVEEVISGAQFVIVLWRKNKILYHQLLMFISEFFEVL